MAFLNGDGSRSEATQVTPRMRPKTFQAVYFNNMISKMYHAKEKTRIFFFW